MKDFYIKDIFEKDKVGSNIYLQCWIKNRRDLGGIIFLNLVDSTGEISTYVKKDSTPIEIFKKIQNSVVESSVGIKGVIKEGSKNQKKEIEIKNFDVIGGVSSNININPSPRKNFNIFESKYINFTLSRRHLFIRNQKIVNIIKVKSILLEAIREWFKKENFIEIDTPILSQTTLYDEDTTFEVDYFGTKVYLSQCAGFYLNSAASAFEKVFTITPAFRAQPSKSPRHNPEFWHIKGQIAFYNLEEMLNFTEQMIFYIVNFLKEKAKKELNSLGVQIDLENLKPPYSRISYTEALEVLKKENIKVKWGNSLNEKAEKLLSNKFRRPLFIMYMPKTIEPFPYALNKKDPKLTMTADLLGTAGYGEILGVAEFIHNKKELIERMRETNRPSKSNRFKWYLELKDYGDVPVAGFGMGIERFLRWLLNLSHIRDTFLFPRLYTRRPYP